MQKKRFVSGALPNIIRNAIVNCSELVTYDVIKELLLKNHLMTGRCTLPVSICSWRCGVFNQSLCGFLHRQHAVSLHRSLLSWLVHHGRGVSGGRRENPLHELSAGAVRWGSELCCNYADQRGTHSFL